MPQWKNNRCLKKCQTGSQKTSSMISNLNKRIYYFTFFRKYLKERVFVVVLLNILVGMLDGLGLTMFLPLLYIAAGESFKGDADLAQINNWIEYFGIQLNLNTVLLLLVAFFSLKGVVYYFKGAYQVATQQYFIKTVRLASISSLNETKYEYFAGCDQGQIHNIITTEIERVAKACQSYFLAFQQLILVLVYVGFAFTLNWKFALMVCAGGLIVDFVYGKVYRKTKAISRQLTDGSGKFQGLIADYFSSYSYLRATGTAAKYRAKLDAQVTEIENKNKRIGTMSVFLSASREPMSIIVLSAVIAIQALVLKEQLATVLVSLLFFYRALSCLMQYQTAWNSFLGVAGSLESTEQLINTLEANKQYTDGIRFSNLRHGLALENVSYSYGTQQVLRNISFTIDKYETVAIVGPSGSGKSTLISLITGLLTPADGRIMADAMDLKEWNLVTFQSRFGYITQNPVIFNDTIFNNVTLWAEANETSRAVFEKACKDAAIWDFVTDRKLQENEVLGAHGINLSGGQRQRIALARELFKSTDFLIMDEATSAMDSFTEKEIQQTIEKLKGTTTIIWIAHQLSTVKNADKIIYINNGSVAQIGSFEELCNENPEFKRMVDLQTIS